MANQVLGFPGVSPSEMLMSINLDEYSIVAAIQTGFAESPFKISEAIQRNAEDGDDRKPVVLVRGDDDYIQSHIDNIVGAVVLVVSGPADQIERLGIDVHEDTESRPYLDEVIANYLGE